MIRSFDFKKYVFSIFIMIRDRRKGSVISRPIPKAGAKSACLSVCYFIIFSRCHKSALLRTLIGSRAVCQSRG